MADLAKPVPLTAEDLPYLSSEEGRCELVAGEIVREPPPGEGHGWTAGKLLVHVGRFVLEHRLGRIYPETGFVLSRNPDTVRAPDAAFVSSERLLSTPRRGPYFEGAPDLAVEVVSPGDTPREVGEKVQEYLAAGARAVWVLDPRAETVTIHRPRTQPGSLSRRDTLDGAPVLPGFLLPVARIFDP